MKEKKNPHKHHGWLIDKNNKPIAEIEDIKVISEKDNNDFEIIGEAKISTTSSKYMGKYLQNLKVVILFEIPCSIEELKINQDRKADNNKIEFSGKPKRGYIIKDKIRFELFLKEKAEKNSKLKYIL